MIVFLLLAILTMKPLCSADAAPQELFSRGALKRVVALSRHGVRSPTEDGTTLNTWRQTTTPEWPDFGVPPGYLTPKGEELAELMGSYYRRYLDQSRIFDPARCPDSVFIRADRDERTMMTAQGLGSGLTLTKTAKKALGCRFAVYVAANSPDPLFHPSEAMSESCPLDPKQVKKAVGKLQPLRDTLKTQLDAEQRILQCCSQKLCEHHPCPDPPTPPLFCSLQTLPACTDAAKGQASIKGGLGIAQSFAEIMRLQYAQGLQFGFGNTDKAEMLDILRLHTVVFDKVQRAPYVAARQGANLLYHIADAIKNGHDPGSPGGSYKFIAYVGHDTNIANVAALLDLHWQLPDYPADDMPPGSALVFELRQPPHQSPLVYAFYAAQAPTGMRNQTGETDRVPVKTKRCDKSGGSCAMEDFVRPLGTFIEMIRPILDANRQCLTD